MSRLPTSLAQLQHDLAATSMRPVDTEQAASVINEVRRHALAAHDQPGFKAADSNRALIESVTEQHVERWMQALGLQAADVESLKRAAFVSGLGSPFGGDLTNVLSYVAAPVIGALSGSPFASLGVSTAVAAAAPFVNAYLQTGVVTRCDVYRERNGPTVTTNKADLSDSLSLKQAAEAVASCSEAFAAACAVFEAANGLHSSTPTPDSDYLAELARTVLSTCEAMCAAQHRALMTQGSHGRQQVGNAHQALPRTLRPIGAGLPALGTSAGEEIERVARYGTAGAVGIQSGAAALLMFAQHFTAGNDERNKALYKNKLNMLYADVFTEVGKLKVAGGEQLNSNDIDPTKLRKLVDSPAQAFVERVVAAIKYRKAGVDEDIEARVSPMFVDLELGLPQQPTAPSPEPGEGVRELRDLKSRSAVLKQELNLLKAGNLEALPQDSAARELITKGLRSFVSPLLDTTIEKKVNTKGEYTAQAIQRLGQAFHMGIFGSAAASTAGRAAAAIAGGAAHACPASTILSCQRQLS